MNLYIGKYNIYEAVRHGPDHAGGPIRPCGPIIVGGPIGAVMLFISIKQLVNRAVPVDFYCNYDTLKKYFHKIN